MRTTRKSKPPVEYRLKTAIAQGKLAPPDEAAFTSRLRSPHVAARVGTWLGVCFGVCFLTGLLSHYAQNPDHPIPFPTSPSWGYRVTQGLHVITGTAAVPLLLVKLWTVFPKLFKRPDFKLRALLIEGLERSSILVLVAGAIFQLATGLLNSSQWYPWGFSFRVTHYSIAWVTIGALVVHIAVKLPIIRDVWTTDVDDTTHDRPTATKPGAISRRGLLRATWLAAGVAVLATAGGTVPFLRKVSIFAVRTGEGPQGVPINRSAEAARVTEDLVGADYRLTIANGDRELTMTLDELRAMAQQTHSLPIACVEGWSAGATWTGVRLGDLLDLVEAPRDADIRITSLQSKGAFGRTIMQDNFARDDRTTLALELNGDTLDLDHGYPARIIAPNRPGVLQTKWVTKLEVYT